MYSVQNDLQQSTSLDSQSSVFQVSPSTDYILSTLVEILANKCLKSASNDKMIYMSTEQQISQYSLSSM